MFVEAVGSWVVGLHVEAPRAVRQSGTVQIVVFITRHATTSVVVQERWVAKEFETDSNRLQRRKVGTGRAWFAETFNSQRILSAESVELTETGKEETLRVCKREKPKRRQQRVKARANWLLVKVVGAPWIGA